MRLRKLTDPENPTFISASCREITQARVRASVRELVGDALGLIVTEERKHQSVSFTHTCMYNELHLRLLPLLETQDTTAGFPTGCLGVWSHEAH